MLCLHIDIEIIQMIGTTIQKIMLEALKYGQIVADILLTIQNSILEWEY